MQHEHQNSRLTLKFQLLVPGHVFNFTFHKGLNSSHSCPLVQCTSMLRIVQWSCYAYCTSCLRVAGC